MGVIERGVSADDAGEIYMSGLSQKGMEILYREAERLDGSDLKQFSRKIRIYYYMAKILDGEQHDRAYALCFETICDAILAQAVKGVAFRRDLRIVKAEAVARLPVRVNWGGGWSDTPPYCLEHGGTVLNAAIMLDGQLPIEVSVRRLAEQKITLCSADSGARRDFFELGELQESRNPHDSFALHKAALIACGVIPYRQSVRLSEILEALGGGLELTTRTLCIPRGSGLGTSSILAGGCVKALYEFFGEPLEENELYNRVLCMEQLMSTGGGWQDQVGGLAPGIKMITSDKGLNQRIVCQSVCLSDETLQALDARFCIIYTGQRRLARNLLREVVGKYVGNDPVALDVLYQIQRVAVLMRFELERGHVDEFAHLLDEQWALSKKLDADCTNTCIEQIFLSIEDLIEGRMICGAGGGGFLQVMLKRGVKREELTRRLTDVFQESGVSVWSCRFV